MAVPGEFAQGNKSRCFNCLGLVRRETKLKRGDGSTQRSKETMKFCIADPVKFVHARVGFLACCAMQTGKEKQLKMH